jgi:hypothetical protein
MGVKVPRTPVKHCACRIIKPGQNTANPDKTTKCREHAARFVDTTNGRVYVCQLHFTDSVIVGSGQDVGVFSRRKA